MTYLKKASKPDWGCTSAGDLKVDFLELKQMTSDEPLYQDVQTRPEYFSSFFASTISFMEGTCFVCISQTFAKGGNLFWIWPFRNNLVMIPDPMIFTSFFWRPRKLRIHKSLIWLWILNPNLWSLILQPYRLYQWITFVFKQFLWDNTVLIHFWSFAIFAKTSLAIASCLYLHYIFPNALS